MDAVQHFEIPYKVRERAKKFYFGAFGWQLFDTPGSDYTFATTVEVQPNGMPKRPGAINGGLVPRSKEVSGPTVFIRVGDLPTHLERVRHAGGTVLTQPVAVGPVWLARVRDTEGNVITVFQENPAAREERDAVVAKASGRKRARGPARAGKASRKAARKAASGKGRGAAPSKASKTGQRRKPAKRTKRESAAVWSR